MVHIRKGSLANPGFEPTEEEWTEVLAGAGRLARWQAAMADQGVKVLALDLTPEERCRWADAWAKEHEQSTEAPD